MVGIAQRNRDRWEGLCEIYRLAQRRGSPGFRIRGLPEDCRRRFVDRGCQIKDLEDGTNEILLPREIEAVPVPAECPK